MEYPGNIECLYGFFRDQIEFDEINPYKKEPYGMHIRQYSRVKLVVEAFSPRDFSPSVS